MIACNGGKTCSIYIQPLPSLLSDHGTRMGHDRGMKEDRTGVTVLLRVSEVFLLQTAPTNTKLA